MLLNCRFVVCIVFSRYHFIREEKMFKREWNRACQDKAGQRTGLKRRERSDGRRANGYLLVNVRQVGYIYRP